MRLTCIHGILRLSEKSFKQFRNYQSYTSHLRRTLFFVVVCVLPGCLFWHLCRACIVIIFVNSVWPQACNFIKKRLDTGFPKNFAKFLRTGHFFYASGWLLLNSFITLNEIGKRVEVRALKIRNLGTRFFVHLMTSLCTRSCTSYFVYLK